MTRMKLSAIARIGCLAATLCFIPIAEAKKPVKPSGALYTIIPFAPDGDSNEDTSVLDLNDVGEAVGYVWHAAAPWESYHVDLGTVPESYTPIPGIVQAINNSGEMVGFTRDEDNEVDLGYYLSGLGAEPMELLPLEGYQSCRAWRINDAGIIVGRSRYRPMNTSNTSSQIAVVWRPVINGEGTLVIDGPVPLFPLAGNPLDGDASSAARNINDPLGGGPFQIVGSSDLHPVSGGLVRDAVTWTIGLNLDGALAQASAATNLGTLDGGRTSANGNNDFGDVCGDSGALPIVKPIGSVMQPLQLMRNALWGHAIDVNELGHVVGNITVSNGNRKVYSAVEYACLWEGFDAGPIKLEKLIDGASGWDSLNSGERINSNGAIAGYGVHNGVNRGFVMWPSQ
jgi:hypothetical protein